MFALLIEISSLCCVRRSLSCWARRTACVTWLVVSVSHWSRSDPLLCGIGRSTCDATSGVFSMLYAGARLYSCCLRVLVFRCFLSLLMVVLCRFLLFLSVVSSLGFLRFPSFLSVLCSISRFSLVFSCFLSVPFGFSVCLGLSCFCLGLCSSVCPYGVLLVLCCASGISLLSVQCRFLSIFVLRHGYCNCLAFHGS